MAGLYIENQTVNPYSGIAKNITLEGDPEWKKRQFPSKPGSAVDAIGGQLDIPLLVGGIKKAISDPALAAGLASEAGLTMGYTPDPEIKRMGMEKKTAPAPITPTVNKPVNNTNIMAPQNNTVTEANKPHPAAAFKDQYAYAESLSPSEFKRLIDTFSPDSPEIAGMGYIEAKDPKTGKMRIEKIINRPGPKGMGMDLSNATIGDIEAIGPILNAMEARKENALYHRGLIEARQSEADTRKAIAGEALQERKRNDFQKKLETFAPTVGVDEANKPIKAHDVGLLDMMDSGQKFKEDDPSFYPAAENLWNTRERWIVDRMKEKNLPYNPDDINRPGTLTNKNRELLKSKYRDLMLKKYQPVQ